MPTYVYRCDADHEFEAVQPITDRPLSVCAVCEAPVRRVVMPVGIVFKGSGFYKTDSRRSSAPSEPAPAAATAKPSESGPGSEPAAPAAGAAAAKAPAPSASPPTPTKPAGG